MKVRMRAKPLLMAALLAIAIGIGTHVHLSQRGAGRTLIVATTTSLYETGILDSLEAGFEKMRPSIDVAFISQGTGLAMKTAMRGDADMVLAHDPERELEFLREGYGVNRKIVAYNFFALVGPKGDPAKVRGLSPLDAFKKIGEAGERGMALWISRGDDSGTHAKEVAIWRAAGFDVDVLRGRGWYLEAGSGMTATLRMADERGAYTLAGLGTYLMNRDRGTIGLEIMVEAGKELLNVYSAMATNPKRAGAVNFEAAMEFIGFLVSEEGQGILERFGIDSFGRPLFHPCAKLLKERRDPELARWIEEVAYFDGEECPPEHRYRAGSLYQAIRPLGAIGAPSLQRRMEDPVR
ncbi:MAG: substrate-binding domain-containing protein [Candidatus Bathyarchaeia archaeon]